jgi:integrase
MHKARHTVAKEVRRVAGLDSASHMLGHSDISTTLAIYGHYEDEDLESAMDSYGRWLEAEENVSPED